MLAALCTVQGCYTTCRLPCPAWFKKGNEDNEPMFIGDSFPGARLAALIAVLLSFTLYAPSTTASNAPTIREVRINIAPIYTEEQAESSSWRTFVNSYHVATRPVVIRRALLFSEGDTLDDDLLAASERGLRRLRFLNKVEIKVVPVDNLNVDVEINATDAWSIEPGVDLDGGGGLSTVKVHLIDHNLFGTGKKVYAELIDESDVGTSYQFGYGDYQLFGSRWFGDARIKTGPLVDSLFVQARRPLFSPDTKWAYGGYAYTADKIVRRFESGEESSRFGEDERAAGMFVTRALGERFKKLNIKLQVKYLKLDYSRLGEETVGDIPPDQENLTPSINVSKQNIRWVKSTYLDKQGLTEDKVVGLNYGGRVGYGIPLNDSIELWDVNAYINHSILTAKNQRVELDAAVNSEVVRNTFVILTGKFYQMTNRHTVALRFTTRLGYELDPSRQYTLGADSGLRGYPAREFTGDKMVLLNLEDRQHWGQFSFGPKFNFGTVVFIDAGNVWTEEESIDLGELNWSTGFGFRLGTTNLPGQPILRVDLGWAIGNDSFAVTVGTEQHF